MLSYDFYLFSYEFLNMGCLYLLILFQIILDPNYALFLIPGFKFGITMMFLIEESSEVINTVYYILLSLPNFEIPLRL